MGRAGLEPTCAVEAALRVVEQLTDAAAGSSELEGSGLSVTEKRCIVLLCEDVQVERINPGASEPSHYVSLSGSI